MRSSSVSVWAAVAVTVALVMTFIPDPVNGVCCHTDSKRRCGDCGKSSSHCGLKDCNLFGCNCDADSNGDICRFGSCFVPPGNNNRPVTGADVLRGGDRNQDGALSIAEANRLLSRNKYYHNIGKRGKREALSALDANQDGVLTADEIDG